MAKKRDTKTQDQIEKQERLLVLQNRVQELLDNKKYEYMSDFTKGWNAKNQEKIEESIKMGNTFIFHIKGGASVTGYSDYMVLG